VIFPAASGVATLTRVAARERPGGFAMNKMNYTWLAVFSAAVAACSSAAAPEVGASTAEELRRGPRVVARFDASKGELPEGLALRGESAYVSFAPLAAIARVDERGVVSRYADLPSTAGGTKGYTLGLAFDDSGALFVAQASFDPSVAPGIYRVMPGGGTVTQPWAQSPAMTFPNGLAFDGSGTLYVADSGGAIFRADRAGNVTEWKRDPILSYDPSACANAPPFPVGANGIVVTSSEAWVTNTSTGAIVRIPIQDDGSAGTAAAIVTDCALAGADGLARGEDGTLIAALNAQNAIARVRRSGSFSVIASGAPLDFPASVVTRDDAIWATNAAFLTAAAGSGQPSLVVYRSR
jgi:hypothetical protein